MHPGRCVVACTPYQYCLLFILAGEELFKEGDGDVVLRFRIGGEDEELAIVALLNLEYWNVEGCPAELVILSLDQFAGSIELLALLRKLASSLISSAPVLFLAFLGAIVHRRKHGTMSIDAIKTPGADFGS